MADIGTSVILASVLVGMVSIPAAAQDLSGSASVSTGMTSISASEEVPSNAVTTTTSSSFARKVETAFSEFGVKIDSNSATTSLEKPGARFTVEKSPGSTVWRLETSSGGLVIRSTSDKVVSTTETPYGTLEETSFRGGSSVNFTGSNRTKVEQIEETLRSKMEIMKKEVRERNSEMVRQHISIHQYSKSLDITVEEEGTEYVKIDSSLSTPVKLKGWNITDEVSGYSFSEVSIPPRGTVYVYSGEEPEDLTRKENSAYVFESGISWNNGGDTATLWRRGEKIVQESY